MKIQVNDKKGFRTDGMNEQTVASRVAKIRAFAANKDLEVISGAFFGVVPRPTNDRERLIETAVNRLCSGEKLHQVEIDA